MLAAIELLAEKGPTLDRPAGGHLRALFVFDPERRAIVLLGGDKRDDWSGWYERDIPKADDLYDEHLRNLDNA